MYFLIWYVLMINELSHVASQVAQDVFAEMLGGLTGLKKMSFDLGVCSWLGVNCCRCYLKMLLTAVHCS